MNAQIYFVEDAIKKGEYKPTTLDYEKKEADMLLQSIDGNYYSLWLNKEVEVKGRGLKERYGRVIVVTEKMYYQLNKTYKILPDF